MTHDDLLLEVQRLRLLKAEHERQIETLLGMIPSELLPDTTIAPSTTPNTTDSAEACDTQRERRREQSA